MHFFRRKHNEYQFVQKQKKEKEKELLTAESIQNVSNGGWGVVEEWGCHQ